MSWWGPTFLGLIGSCFILSDHQSVHACIMYCLHWLGLLSSSNPTQRCHGLRLQHSACKAQAPSLSKGPTHYGGNYHKGVQVRLEGKPAASVVATPSSLTFLQAGRDHPVHHPSPHSYPKPLSCGHSQWHCPYLTHGGLPAGPGSCCLHRERDPIHCMHFHCPNSHCLGLQHPTRKKEEREGRRVLKVAMRWKMSCF